MRKILQSLGFRAPNPMQVRLFFRLWYTVTRQANAATSKNPPAARQQLIIATVLHL
jgi:hypothetical protein